MLTAFGGVIDFEVDASMHFSSVWLLCLIYLLPRWTYGAPLFIRAIDSWRNFNVNKVASVSSRLPLGYVKSYDPSGDPLMLAAPKRRTFAETDATNHAKQKVTERKRKRNRLNGADTDAKVDGDDDTDGEDAACRSERRRLRSERVSVLY